MTSKKKSKMTLAQWIDLIGIDAVAVSMGATKSSVWQWRRGHCLPRTHQMLTIKKMSRGRVSYDTMIDTFHLKSKKA